MSAQNNVLSDSVMLPPSFRDGTSTVLPLRWGRLSKHYRIVHKCITIFKLPLRNFSVCNDISKVPRPNKKFLMSTNIILASPFRWTPTSSLFIHFLPIHWQIWYFFKFCANRILLILIYYNASVQKLACFVAFVRYLNFS